MTSSDQKRGGKEGLNAVFFFCLFVSFFTCRSLQRYRSRSMVNAFPLIFVIVLGDFLFCVTAVNKMFNLRAGGDVACYRVAGKRRGAGEE